MLKQRQKPHFEMNTALKTTLKAFPCVLNVKFVAPNLFCVEVSYDEPIVMRAE